MSFTLSQEVSRHVRANACQFQHTPINATILWNCSQCLFTTDSQAECFFHEVLHTTPSTEIYKEGDKDTVIKKYSCPICCKSFRKASLRHHLRQHTFERPFVCSVCGANFTRQSSLANHSRNEHGADVIFKVGKLPKINEVVETSVKEEFACGKCKKAFSSK